MSDVSKENQIPVTQIEVTPQAPSVWSTLFWDGVWKNNSALVQLLGLCPLLAVSNDIRIPIYVMVIATVVTAVQLLMNAFAYPVYQSLGIFIPLIVTNCIVIGRAEAYASKNSVAHAAFDGFTMGLGSTMSLVLLGAIRELLGNGTLFDGLDLLLGSWAKSLRLDVLHLDSGLLLAILPPGAFIGLGIMLAVKNLIDKK